MNANPAPCRVALIGLMGAGKSRVGRQLAALLGWPFWDGDRLIEERAGTDVPTLFQTRGEAAFRALESDVLSDLGRDAPPLVAALGGGVVETKENRDLLQSSFYVVWLDVTAETAAERVGSGTGRPLLALGSPLETLRQLHARRRPWFIEVAHLTLDAGANAGDLGPAIARCLPGH